MSIRNLRVCSIVFAGALAVAAPGMTQTIGSGGSVIDPVGPGSMERRSIGPEPIRPFTIGPGPMGPGPVGPGPLGPGPVGRPSMDLYPLSIGAMVEAPMRLMWGDQDRPDRQDRQAEADQRERERETRIYDQGRDFIDQGKYDRAIDRFNDVVSMKGARADAALYYKAWAQNKAGQRADAITTISTLAKEYPKSRYLGQAKALESEVRRDSGQPVRPESESDDDLKLMAINALQNSEPEQAIPMLEKLLEGTASPKVKSRALFVLAQSNSPRGRDVLKRIARGSSTPELQNRAIDYLGQQGGSESRAALAEIYGTAGDVDVKRRILRAFMIGGDKGRLLTAAQTEQSPDLRAEAVQQLGVMGAHDELWQLYQKESSVDVKKRIIQAMFVGGNATRLIELAKGEKDPELRRTAVRNLGVMDSKRTSDALIEIYNADKDPAIRKAVIQGLFQQSNAAALVDLARKEQDPSMKKAIVQMLSVMGDNPVATAYMLELLNGK